TAAATAWDPNPAGGGITRVSALATMENTVFVGGSFTTVGGQPRSGFAALDAANGVARPWQVESTGPAQRIAVSARAVFAAGPVLSNGKVARRNAAALD